MKTLRAWLLKKLLTPTQRMLIATIERPDRWQPDVPLTSQEAQQWGELLRSPLLLKVDVAMVNIAQQEAQRAIAAPSAETQRMAGYALGVRSAWQIAKAISTLSAAEGAASEGTGADTATPALEHLAP
jgi:hypothetical protein